MSEHQACDPADILLVEDNPGDVRLTEEAFKEGQINTTLHVVEDGIEALDFLFKRNEYADAPRPDIVLLDLNLPRKNGDEVLAEIRNNLDLRRIPVVVLTSSETQGDVIKSYELHANAYLTKPVNPPNSSISSSLLNGSGCQSSGYRTPRPDSDRIPAHGDILNRFASGVTTRLRR